jgi:hypothetical protein
MFEFKSSANLKPWVGRALKKKRISHGPETEVKELQILLGQRGIEF